jgi:putative restriction endonuclease
MKRRSWTRKELILTFNLYCKLPFGKLHSRNPDIIYLAEQIGRTANAVALKLVNFASLDPELKKRGIKGMSSCSKHDKLIFEEFNNNWDKLVLESELLLDSLETKKLENIELDTIIEKTGEEKLTLVKTRVNQNFFRKMVLVNYDEKCALCSLNHTSLLMASHIVPWSQNKEHRLNPKNGLCLCAIHDKAFDRGLISFDENLTILFSNEITKIKEKSFVDYFGQFEGQELNVPKKFYPSLEFLEFHCENIFR